jgi:hypothetical protein
MIPAVMGLRAELNFEDLEEIEDEFRMIYGY